MQRENFEVANVYSRNWEARQSGYTAIERQLAHTLDGDDAKSSERARATEPLVVRGLGDTLFSVYAAALELLKQEGVAFSTCGKSVKIYKSCIPFQILAFIKQRQKRQNKN